MLHIGSLDTFGHVGARLLQRTAIITGRVEAMQPTPCWRWGRAVGVWRRCGSFCRGNSATAAGIAGCRWKNRRLFNVPTLARIMHLANRQSSVEERIPW